MRVVPDESRTLSPLSLAFLTALAILAFAGNSLIARMALANGAIEAGAFSVIRLAAGAAILVPFIKARPTMQDARGALPLLIYIAGFSLAYVTLSAATGALILFGCVQASIMTIGVIQGARPRWNGWAGLGIALAGLAWLFLPGSEAVQPAAGAMMAIAGAAWGVYTIIGRGARDPARDTAVYFLIAAPLSLPLLLLDQSAPSAWGVGLAIVAGALTSGLGYVIWYRVAPLLKLATSASVQLATPIVAALGGAILLAEPLTADIAIAGGLIIGGILMTIRR